MEHARKQVSGKVETALKEIQFCDKREIDSIAVLVCLWTSRNVFDLIEPQEVKMLVGRQK